MIMRWANKAYLQHTGSTRRILLDAMSGPDMDSPRAGQTFEEFQGSIRALFSPLSHFPALTSRVLLPGLTLSKVLHLSPHALATECPGLT